MNPAHRFCATIVLLIAAVPISAQDKHSTTEERKRAALSGIAMNTLTGEPLAHVEVWLLRRISGRFSSYRHVATGLDGRFSLTDIEAGSFFLSAERTGYHRVDIPPSESPPTMQLKPGEEIRDILLRLEPYAVIAGRVVDANGAPMERVKVEAIGHFWAPASETDDRGAFAIGNLLPGRYLLRASSRQAPLPEIRKDGSGAINYGITYFPSAKTAGGGVPVSAKAGQESSVEIRMAPAPVLHISGNVSGDTGDGRPEIKLESVWDDLRTGGIDKRKSFAFSNVPAGRYRLYAEDSVDGNTLQSAPVLIDLTNASVEGIHLALLPAVGLTGHIKDEDRQQMMTHVRKEAQKSSIEIKLRPLGFLVPDESYTIPLSDEGSFPLREISPGRYNVTMAGAPENFYVKSVTIGEREFDDGTVEVGGGQVQQDMVIDLGLNGAEVSGIVRDQRGGVGGAMVCLLVEDASFSTVAKATRTSEDGSYIIHGIRPGRYKLLAVGTNDGNPLLTDEVLELDRDSIEKIEVRDGDKISSDLRIKAQ
jgi:hypothetical protein